VTMPRVTVSNHKNTRSYIPKFSNEFTPPLRYIFEFIENRHIYEGQVLDPNFDNMVYLNTMFGMIRFNRLLTINEQIVPRFILEFYSQFCLDYNSKSQMLVEFVIQNNVFSLTLEEFSQIIRIPIEGQCSFSDKWSLDNLKFSVTSSGLYQTTPPTPDDIKLYVQVEMEEPLNRTRHSQTINVEENQILTREITPIMKTWVDIIRENVFCLGVVKQMELVTKQARLILPYGMLLTRLFNHVMSNYPELSNDRYVLYDPVIHPLSPHYESKIRKDYGTKRGLPSTSASSTSTFDHPSSSYHVDENDDENDKGLHKDGDADASFHFRNSDKYYHDPEECEYAGPKVTTSHEGNIPQQG
ncbi:hypothetical protein Tco_0156772, partial [Tanacetum coccineum]